MLTTFADLLVYARLLLSWRALITLLLALNLKNLPFFWHYRVYRLLFARKHLSLPVRAPDHASLWLPAITRSHAPLLETDINLHKSNSTYLSDIDISRANLALLLMGRNMAATPWSDAPWPLLGGVSCVWRREIASYTTYEMWSRVLSWDEKWFYSLTTFVEAGAFTPRQFYLQDGEVGVLDPVEVKPVENAKPLRAVYASGISRIVLKRKGKTVAPEEMLRRSGLLPPEEDKEACEQMEKMRKERLEIAQLQKGWDAVHAIFLHETDRALGRYTDSWRR